MILIFQPVLKNEGDVNSTFQLTTYLASKDFVRWEQALISIKNRYLYSIYISLIRPWPNILP